METFYHSLLIKLHRKYDCLFNSKETFLEDNGCQDPDVVSQWIIDILEGENPCMISRFGSTELSCVVNCLQVKSGKKHLKDLIINGKYWWLLDSVKNNMQQLSGFFPINDESLFYKFTDLLLEDASQIDLLGTWLSQETELDSILKCKKGRLLFLEPFWSNVPWTKVLRGKNILVVHPFAHSILSQYQKRQYLFDNPDILPEFNKLTVIQAVQSVGGTSHFDTWFDALDYMKAEIDKCIFDIALIGCGAYGMPLAAHCKRKGKKAVHLGGSLQLLFGIRGARWEDPDYGKNSRQICSKVNYANLINDYWVRPLKDETPRSAVNIENGCYW